MTTLKQSQEKARNKMAELPQHDGDLGNVYAYMRTDDIRYQLDQIIKQVYEDVVHEVEGMKKYAETTISSTDYGNMQNSLLREHIGSYNQALDDLLNKLKN